MSNPTGHDSHSSPVSDCIKMLDLTVVLIHIQANINTVVQGEASQTDKQE